MWCGYHGNWSPCAHSEKSDISVNENKMIAFRLYEDNIDWLSSNENELKNEMIDEKGIKTNNENRRMFLILFASLPFHILDSSSVIHRRTHS
jgi:hypothetical protein